VSTFVSYEAVTISSAMHRGVVTCRPETPLTKVAQMMAAHRIHSVVVWSEAQETDEEGTLWGVVSDLDLARAIATGELGSTARAVTSTPVVTVALDESIRRAAELMVGHAVAHLVVVGRGRPVGVTSTLASPSPRGPTQHSVGSRFTRFDRQYLFWMVGAGLATGLDAPRRLGRPARGRRGQGLAANRLRAAGETCPSRSCGRPPTYASQRARSARRQD
jgi:CBS domain-containing protein